MFIMYSVHILHNHINVVGYYWKGGKLPEEEVKQFSSFKSRPFEE